MDTENPCLNLILLLNLNCQYNLKEQIGGDDTTAVRSNFVLPT